MNYSIFRSPLLMSYIVLAALILGLSTQSHGRDLGQWDNQDPEITEFYKKLKQPDSEGLSCCGEADLYWADGFEQDPSHPGMYVAIITDDRPDEPRMRKHIPIGTKILVPKHKMYGPENSPGNPTGHGLIFINPYAVDMILDGQPVDEHGMYGGLPVVFCYLPPGGI